MNYFKKALLLPFLLTGIATSAQEKLPLDPAVRTGGLPNGFTYFIRHNEEPKHRVYLYLVNKVGSVLEDEAQRGLAHFMEHMSFNGTTHFPHNDLVNYLQKAGIRFGADLNAYTSFDETVYQLPIPSDKPDVLNQGLLIMHDWAQSVTLDPEEIDKERGVVLEEKRLGKGAGERMQRQYIPMVLNYSRYAERQAIGDEQILKTFKPDTIKRFYNDWYRPDLQALVIVGDVNADSLEKVIRKQFADLHNPVNEKKRTVYTIPLIGKDQFMALTDPEMTSTQASVLIKHKAPLLQTTADYRYAITVRLFNRMLSERYSELSRLPDPPFVSGEAAITSFFGDLDDFDAEVTAKPNELEKGLKAVWREVERVKRFGFTQTELDRMKAAYLSNMEERLKEKDKTPSMQYVSQYQAYFLKSMAAPSIEQEYQLLQKYLPGISLNDVSAVTNDYISDMNRDILIMAPEKEKDKLPDEATINSWLGNITKEHLEPYKDEVSILPFLARQPKKGKIVAERKDDRLQATFLTLGNGAKVILKPTDFRNDEIQFAAVAEGGTSLVSDADYQSTANAIALLSPAGLGNYNKTALDKYLTGKQIVVKLYINPQQQGFVAYAAPKDLETALQMVYAWFTEPRKDKAAFDGVIARTKARLAGRSGNPMTVFSDTVDAILFDHNPRYSGPVEPKVAQINLDKAYTNFKQRFGDASNFTFVFAGNIDINTIKPLLEKYIGSLPSTHQQENWGPLDVHPPYGQVTRTVCKGSEDKASVRLVYSGLFDYSSENVIEMQALKEALNIRLTQRLREEESGVYSPGVSLSTYKYPKARYNLTIQFNCAPANVEKLIASANEEVAKLRTAGPSQENVDKWRAEDRNFQETQLKTNTYWVSYLTAQISNHEDLHQFERYDALRDKVTVADLKAMANQYLNGKNYIRLVLLPETNAKK